MFKEQVCHCCAPQAKRHSAKESIQSSESNQFTIRAGSARGSGGCNGDGDADYVYGSSAVDVGDGVPEEG